ncbi:leucyl/phenylalanyl-tRNA--protein transferase [Streptomyces cahuitamycinicus]|uniref:Leucyl/phenylalanyl-tRNA--protein transferase n=1 Tax=Streptomyces cahuitamycinicus TaxID=2070367 RepID=A0A2N8TR27_9ACTN|nr:leucyl/phenylalanyl-tRNA--protein transferase [Streptomyces cahuitamycinicus]PNG21468.1 leucyl/phenylalanyl-tRNA--protein transferase [Streptomyces cahuitamycinicus]
MVSRCPRWEALDVLEAAPDGPVAFSADLSPVGLLAAYHAGVYPFPASDEYTRALNEVVFADHVQEGRIPLVGEEPADPFAVSWWSPDPRPVLPVSAAHLSRSLARRLRNGLSWSTSLNQGFERVVRECRGDRVPLWLTDDLIASLVSLHELGHAHSVEVWEDGNLIGGVFGLRVGSVFSMDSMFFQRPGASKVAVSDLAARFAQAGGELLDAQRDSPHVRDLGGILMPREQYVRRLRRTARDSLPMPTATLPARRLAEPAGSR